jgi:hypothetical protein
LVVFGVGLDGDFYLRTRLKSHLLAFSSLRTFSMRISIEIVGAFDGDLGFLGYAGVGCLDDFFHGSRQSGTGLLALIR